MVRVTIQGNACHVTSRTATVPHDRIHSNAGTKATVSFFMDPHESVEHLDWFCRFCTTHGCALWSPPAHGSMTVYRNKIWYP